MRVLIAGSHGLVGGAVTRRLKEAGHEVTCLVRGAAAAGQVHWDPDAGIIDQPALEGFDAVVHVATMPWPMRWTGKARKDMRANRLATNGLLASALAACARKPRVLVCASGMGYYAASGETIITEETPCGESFLAGLQRDGEAATEPASRAGIRVVHLRIPPVIGGPALERGAVRAGDGRQWVSWIGLDELACIVEFAVVSDGLCGGVNAVSPCPVRAGEFADVTSAALGGRSATVMPAFLVRLVMGEMGDELLLASRRMQPGKLLAAGYRFQYPDLADALRHEQAVIRAMKDHAEPVAA